jgi:hypothetical protein
MRRILFVLISLGPVVLVAQEHARVLDQTTTYLLDAVGGAEIRESYTIRISSEQGKSFAVYYDYIDKFRKITDVSIEIRDTQGERVKRLKRSDGRELGFNQSYEISDAKILYIDPEYQNYPFVMTVSTVEKLNGFISLPTWTPRDRFHLAVDKATLIIDRPVSFTLRLKEENITGNSIRKDARLVTTYHVADLPAVEEKMRYSDFYEAAAKVLVSPDRFVLDDSEGSLASWKDFGGWFLELNNEPYELTQATKTFIDGLDKSKKEEMIRKIYKYMQDKTRYISIQIGIGGFKSLPTELVEKFGYGDCKALTTYMKNMLDYAGVPSNYILVRAGRDVPDVKADFPSNQFNHVFLGIPMPGDTLMLECTSQTSPTDFTGSFTDDRNVLWMQKGNSRIIRSRIYNHEQNRKESAVKIALNTEGNAKVDYATLNKGIFFDEVMLYDAAPQDYVKEHNHKLFPYSDFAIKDFSYKQENRDVPEYKSSFSLVVNGLARQTGQRLIMGNVPIIPFDQFIRFDDLAAFCAIKRGMTVVDDVEIAMPEGFWIYNLPAPETITSSFGEYKLSTEFDGQILKIRRSFTLFKGDYTGDSYSRFKEFHQKVQKLESRKLVMNSKT